MSAWRGKDGAWHVDGLPHVTKIKAKPKGVGLMLNTSADAATRILLAVDMAEGKEANARKEYAGPGISDGTALTLRLTKRYHNSHRRVAGDSRFAGVATAVRLRSSYGLDFTGVVKTASKCFPKAYLMEHEYKSKGDHLVLTTSIEKKDQDMKVDLMALGWKDKKVKSFVSTFGSTEPGDPSIRKRTRIVDDDEGRREESKEVLIKRPRVVQNYFDAANAVDVHDHFRQGGLCMEEEWRTQKWHIAVFRTLLAMIFTCSYLAYKYFFPAAADGRSTKKFSNFSDFCAVLAHELIFNSMDEGPAGRAGERHDEPDDDDTDDDAGASAHQPKHRLELLHKHPAYAGQKRKQIRCRAQIGNKACKTKASFYCPGCSDDKPFGICGPQTGRHCFSSLHDRGGNK